MNCPHCHRLLYSRQHKKCGHCGAELPPEALFTKVEIKAIKAEQEAIATRRAQAKAKEEEEEKKRKAAQDSNSYMPPF